MNQYHLYGPDEEDRPKPRPVSTEDEDFEENYSDLEGANKETAITETDPNPDFLE